MTDTFNAEVLLSMQRALWECVTPDLRGVAVSETGVEASGSINARFLYEGDVGDLQRECTSLAETYCIADFSPSVIVEFQAVPHASRELEDSEHWVYLRWERTADLPNRARN